ncbi:MAG: UvrD-helicase domain-containing protein, partial [Terracidiphilus sp.]
MPEATPAALPPDHQQRKRALDSSRSILVEAPAGSGKTNLLTRRFLRLLAEVDEPGQIVAITFTRAAAAEMRHRILAELERAASTDARPQDAHADSIEFLAQQALERAQEGNWRLIDLPSQLRISTIDSFCRDLALQQPFLSGFGADLNIHEQPTELHRRAARRTLEKLDSADASLRAALETLLLWRDNN